MTTVNCLGTYIVPTAAREITMPAQPAFLELLGGVDLNVTGNGAVYIIGTNVDFFEIYDQNNDFNVNGTFTAPVTGRYLLTTSVTSQGCAAGMTQKTSELVTTNRTYLMLSVNVFNLMNVGFSGMTAGSSVIADMDATDTATYNITISGGGGDTAAVRSVLNGTVFSGKLIC